MVFLDESLKFPQTIPGNETTTHITSIIGVGDLNGAGERRQVEAKELGRLLLVRRDADRLDVEVRVLHAPPLLARRLAPLRGLLAPDVELEWVLARHLPDDRPLRLRLLVVQQPVRALLRPDEAGYDGFLADIVDDTLASPTHPARVQTLLYALERPLRTADARVREYVGRDLGVVGFVANELLTDAPDDLLQVGYDALGSLIRGSEENTWVLLQTLPVPFTALLAHVEAHPVAASVFFRALLLNLTGNCTDLPAPPFASERLALAAAAPRVLDALARTIAGTEITHGTVCCLNTAVAIICALPDIRRKLANAVYPSPAAVYELCRRWKNRYTTPAAVHQLCDVTGTTAQFWGRLDELL